MNWLLYGFAGVSLALATACSQAPAAPTAVFVTEHGLGPDKWATAWLLTKRIMPGAQLIVVEPEQPLPEGTTFDVPSSDLQRVGNRSAFEVTLDTYGQDDPDVRRLAQIIHDIEIDFWSPDKSIEVQLVEQAFRELQRGSSDAEVSPECYVAFFDVVYAGLVRQRTGSTKMSMDSLAIDCGTSVIATQNRLVPEVSIPFLLTEMRRGKSVAFVDVREPDEYEEAHIPGALNITLRDLNREAVSKVEQADYVVAYCVKDFRGFEMARALRGKGVKNAVILRPYGMKGWLSEGLPMTGLDAMNETEAKARLTECVSSPGACTASQLR